jgi:hypothetical protein
MAETYKISFIDGFNLRVYFVIENVMWDPTDKKKRIST